MSQPEMLLFHTSKTPEGETVLEWWCRQRKLTVYVDSGDFVRIWGPDTHTDMSDGVVSRLSDLASHLQWVKDGG